MKTITEDMQEPEADGPYLITNSADGGAYPRMFVHNAAESWHPWMDDISWNKWSTVRRECAGWDIESLADRDARIRREALTLNDDEIRAAKS